ncbi:flavodoxin domain-containing protein [Streptomyces neyagawaensis]|uniref:flavodoxin domain-containing protein n=1 Tax=Streptomyces neyagawaensis TaxID=42238 RepID=UPI0006E417DB|nr:flavodoxin domain-containing protein [Streptomyces neyagawaensis]MCL6735860.1 flavodoxin domain-containing protein [Streptomyces neyagawaensis]MDE1686334.1 flavodoxin domain-containing protein [Streptomyces neyagawaensis]
MDVLVGFATAHGSTREIAERLAAQLREAGLKAEARAMETVDDADAYRAFVLGSAVHGQAWLDPAKDFVRDNLGLLGAGPVWLFSVGMPGALRGPGKRLAPREADVIVASLPGDLSYRAHRLLSGVIARSHLPFKGRIMFRLMGGRFGDYRDWDAIDAWAADIAAELAHR